MAIIGKPITLGGKGGGTFPTIAVSAETGATITATNGNESISFDEVDSGLYVGYPTDYGTWTVTAVSGSRGATATVEVTEVMLYSISMTLFGATLAITAPSGATVTVVDPNGTTVNTHTATGSAVNVTVYSAGTYTITAVDGADEASTTATVSTDGESVQVNVQFIPAVLNDATWEQISAVSTAGTAPTIWSVGDRKAVALNGTVGICTFSNATYYAYIIGFDHNAALEGSGRIHFLFGKTALSGGTDICFTDNYYNGLGSGAVFCMNTSSTNSGGWNNSYMRKTICGTSLSSYSGTFIAVLPAALRSVLKTVTKYTDNTGGGSNTASYVTATTDVIFLLSEWEVFGKRTYANSAEKNYQAQYAYYAAGNSKVKYKHNGTENAAIWWLRSPLSDGADFFVRVFTGGTATYYYANYSYGFAPGFCV